VYDFGEADGQLYLAMRYVAGPDLAKLIRAEGPLDLNRTGTILAQVGEALDAAHAAGLVHRDVKPANIFVAPTRRPDPLVHAYIGDFGLALRLDAGLDQMTRSLLSGTPSYVAPERWTGAQPDATADVYALGCVAYACLTGRPPFAGENTGEVGAAHQHLPPPMVSPGRPHLPPAVDTVLARAVAKLPADRYQTCGEFVADLRDAAAGVEPAPSNRVTPSQLTLPPPPASPPAPAVAARAPAARRPAGARQLALMVAAVLVVVAGLTLAMSLPSTVPGTPTAGAGRAATVTRLGQDLDALVADANGNRYLAMREDSMIKKITPDGHITTIVGERGKGFAGDDGPAGAAKIDYPHGLAVDEDGNLYVADTGNHRVRRIDPAGVITTVAGTGVDTSDGDGGPALKATFNSPVDIAVAPDGGLYVAEADGYRVRRIDEDGQISTVAGTGESDYSGDGGPADAAAIGYVTSIAVHDGVLFVADPGNDRVRRVDKNGSITTVAGNGTDGSDGDGGPATAAELTSPDTIAVDAAGTLYIAQYRDHRVRKVDAGGTITTLAGTGEAGYSGDGGPADEAQLANPNALLVNADGSVDIGDANNERVRRVSPNGVITTVAGDGPDYPGDGHPAVDAFLDDPQITHVTTDGVRYIADASNDRIRKVDPNGTITTVAGTGARGFSGDGGPATAAQLAFPSGVVVDKQGNLYIADSKNHRVRKVDRDGVITTVAGTGADSSAKDGGPAIRSALDTPVDVALDKEGTLYVAELGASRIRRVNQDGVLTTVAGNGTEGFSGDDGPATSAQLASPTGVHVAADGAVYIADDGNSRVRTVDPAGTITTVAGNGTEGFAGDGGPATAAQLTSAVTVTTDEAGNVYVADEGAHRVRRIDTDGVITTAAGTGDEGVPEDGTRATSADLDKPVGVSIDSDGRLYIADSGADRVYVIATDGTIATVAGSD
jgi:sugar lactone lactonase YvrE